MSLFIVAGTMFEHYLTDIADVNRMKGIIKRIASGDNTKQILIFHGAAQAERELFAEALRSALKEHNPNNAHLIIRNCKSADPIRLSTEGRFKVAAFTFTRHLGANVEMIAPLKDYILALMR